MEGSATTAHIGSYVFNDVGAVLRAPMTRGGLTTFSPDRTTYFPKASRSHKRNLLRGYSPDMFRKTGSYGFPTDFDVDMNTTTATRRGQDLEAIRKGLKQREKLRNYPLTMGSDPCANLFAYLHTVNQKTGSNCPLVRIPTTVFFENGEVREIYFTDRRGVLRLKSDLRKNLDVVLDEMTKNPKTSWREYPVAVQRHPDQDFHLAEELDYESCVAMCDKRSSTYSHAPHVLQRYLLPTNSANIGYIVAVWTEKAVHMEWNRVSITRRNGRIVPGSKKVLAEQVPLRRGNRLYNRILDTCEAIAKHVESVSPQNYKFALMELVFKVCDLGKLHFCWANKLKLDSERAEAEKKAMLASVSQSQRWNAKIVQERSRKMSEMFRTTPDIFQRNSSERYQVSRSTRSRTLSTDLLDNKLPRIEAGSLAQLDSTATPEQSYGTDGPGEDGGAPSGDVDWGEITANPGLDES